MRTNLDRHANETRANVAQSLKLAGDAVNRVGRLVEDIVEFEGLDPRGVLTGPIRNARAPLAAPAVQEIARALR